MILLKDVHSWKADPPILVRLGGSVIVHKDEHPEKAPASSSHPLPASISVTVPGHRHLRQARAIPKGVPGDRDGAQRNR